MPALRSSRPLGCKLHQLSSEIKPGTFHSVVTDEEGQDWKCNDGQRPCQGQQQGSSTSWTCWPIRHTGWRSLIGGLWTWSSYEDHRLHEGQRSSSGAIPLCLHQQAVWFWRRCKPPSRLVSATPSLHRRQGWLHRNLHCGRKHTLADWPTNPASPQHQDRLQQQQNLHQRWWMERCNHGWERWIPSLLGSWSWRRSRREEHRLRLRDERHLWCHQQLRGPGQLHHHPRVPLHDQQNTTRDCLPGGRDGRGRDLLRRPRGWDPWGRSHSRSPWDHHQAHQDDAHGVQWLQQEVARRRWRESSSLTKRASESSGRSTVDQPTSQRPWSTMDGRCSPLTTTLAGTLTSRHIAGNSLSYKTEYALTSSGTARSALNGHHYNSWTWRRIDVEHSKMNVTIRRKCISRWCVEATWSNDVKGVMEPSSSQGMPCHGRPAPSKIFLAHHACWTNASSKSWWPTMTATISTSRSLQGYNALMRAWQMSSTCSAQVTTTTFPWKAAHLELETERQHLVCTKEFSVTAWASQLWTSSSTRTPRRRTTSTQRSMLARRLRSTMTWTSTPSPMQILHFRQKILTPNERSNDVEEFYNDWTMRTSRQPREPSCGSTETLGTPPTRSWSDFWSPRTPVTPFSKPPKNMNVVCAICTRGRLVFQSQACQRTRPSTSVFKLTPFGSRFRVFATNSLCWWCQMRWPAFLQQGIWSLRPRRSTSSNLRWLGLASSALWRPCRSTNTEPGHQMPCENGQQNKASNWWSAQGNLTRDWPSLKGGTKWLERPSAFSWSLTRQWLLTEMHWSLRWTTSCPSWTGHQMSMATARFNGY